MTTDNSETNTPKNEKPATRKRKRAQRNKERLISHQSKLLDNLAAGILEGYSDEGWANLTKLYHQVSDFITPDERRQLGALWRNSYVGTPDLLQVSETVNLVKARLLSAVS
jgi:hypothetical protein